jgi:hypothetical protein
MKINPGNGKTIRFKTAWVKNPLRYSLGDQNILEVSICKYLEIILGSDLNCVDQVNYSAKSLEGASLCNACSQKRKQEYK